MEDLLGASQKGTKQSERGKKRKSEGDEPPKKRQRRMVKKTEEEWTYIGYRIKDKEWAASVDGSIMTLGRLLDLEEDGKIEIKEIPGERVQLIPTPEERNAQQKVYREEYRNRPGVKEKRTEKSHTEEEKQKRKSYSSNPAVKERKKLLSQRRRRTLKEAKKEYPDIMAKCEQKVAQDLMIDLPSYQGKNWVRREAWLSSQPLVTQVC